jgi:uncharacterized protein YjbI with pentapeptide repeats
VFEHALFLNFPTFAMCEFRGSASFAGAVFEKGAVFQQSRFNLRADFSRCEFLAHADFVHVIFGGDALFSGSKFREGAIANSPPQGGNFTESIFVGPAKFTLSEFKGTAGFGSCGFNGGADFSGCEFEQAQFSFAKFRQEANFSRTQFRGSAYFREAQFEGLTDFSDLCCHGGLLFVLAAFRQDVSFARSEFEGAVDCSGARFMAALRLYETGLKTPTSADPSLILSGAQLDKPAEVVFYKTDLSRAIFHNCRVSDVVFSDVTWMERPGVRKKMIFDEVVPLNHNSASALKPGADEAGVRNYRLLAELYQQLKKNYDDRRDYWTAGDFHYGEMEMRRLHGVSHSRLVRWWHERFGVLALYRFASAYGENYVRPGLGLLLTLALFGVLYAALGLNRTSVHPSLGGHPAPVRDLHQNAGQGKVSGPRQERHAVLRSGMANLRDGLLTSLEVATFSKAPLFEPPGRWGRLAAISESLLTSSFAALFLLALRRQFRR